MRYTGQEYTINVSLGADLDLGKTIGDFHAAHERRYGHASPRAPVEFVNLRVAAMGALKKYTYDQVDAIAEEPSLGRRQAVFDARSHDTIVLARDRLPAGYSAAGPAIIEEQSATTVVPPGWDIRGRSNGESVADEGESMSAVDPITTEIIRNAFISIANDMNATLIRSAFTPIIYEGKDCSVALIDEQGEVLGQSLGLPLFLGNLENLCAIDSQRTRLGLFQRG